MAKKKSFQLTPLTILFIVTAAVAVLAAIFFFFLPLTTYKVPITGKTIHTKFKDIWDIVNDFGGDRAGFIRTELIIMIILTIVFIAAGVLKLFAAKQAKLLSIVTAAAALLFVIVLLSLMSNLGSTKNIFLDFEKAFKNSGAGFIMAFIFGLIGLGSSVGEIVLNK